MEIGAISRKLWVIDKSLTSFVSRGWWGLETFAVFDINMVYILNRRKRI
jgi:hypothetical protein